MSVCGIYNCEYKYVFVRYTYNLYWYNYVCVCTYNLCVRTICTCIQLRLYL